MLDTVRKRADRTSICGAYEVHGRRPVKESTASPKRPFMIVRCKVGQRSRLEKHDLAHLLDQCHIACSCHSCDLWEQGRTETKRIKAVSQPVQPFGVIRKRRQSNTRHAWNSRWRVGRYLRDLFIQCQSRDQKIYSVRKRLGYIAPRFGRLREAGIKRRLWRGRCRRCGREWPCSSRTADAVRIYLWHAWVLLEPAVVRRSH